MIRTIFLLAYFIHFSLSLFGQNTVDDPSDLMHLFDKNVIKFNKITSVKASVAFKYDLDVIHKTGGNIILEFDQSGLVKRIIEIKPFKNRIDSIVTLFIRNKLEAPIVKVKSDALYTYVEIMSYNNDLLISHQFYQMKKTKNWNNNLYDKHLMWSDSISYKDNKIVIYNKYGNSYRSQHIERNEINQIIKNGFYDQSGRWFKTISYDYNSSLLVNMGEINNNTMMFNWLKKYEYNENNLWKIEYYKNEKLEYVRKLSYNSNGLLELDLKRIESNKKMMILQFKYFK